MSPQIANPQSATFVEGPKVRKFADLRIAELICGPPTFVFVDFMHAF
jgi:hypothetical protein